MEVTCYEVDKVLGGSIAGLAFSGSCFAAETGKGALVLQEDGLASITILVEGMMKSRSGAT